MSWADLVNNQLMSAGMCCAGIYGLDGNAWAVSGSIGSSIQPAEILRLIKIIQGTELNVNSMRIGGMPFLYLQHDEADSCITLSRINPPKGEEKFVCAGYLSRLCFVFGVVSENCKVGNCRNATNKLREYLKQTGY